MGFMGKIFSALGFESETKSKKKTQSSKASYKLKAGQGGRVNEIDGVPVYYPENFDQAKDFVDFALQHKAVIISVESCDKEVGVRILDFLQGFCKGSNSRFIILNEQKLYLILPEGMEIED